MLMAAREGGQMMRHVFGGVFGFFLAVGGLTAADPAPEAKTGIKVGEKAPDFKLKDQAGAEQSLSAMIKDGPVAIVFFRSASW